MQIRRHVPSAGKVEPRTGHRSTAGPVIRRQLWRTGVGSAILVGVLLATAVVPAIVGAAVGPAANTVTVTAGGSVQSTLTVDVPAVPPKADILIAIDTTGSMGTSIAQAKADANMIVSGIQAQVADSQFAIVSFRDSGDGAEEYRLRQSMTSSASAVQTAVNALSAAGGNDNPEAHNLVFHNSYTPATGGDIGWRTGTKKIVVVISDAEPHGAGSAVPDLPGCLDASADPHGRNTRTELAGMDAADRTLFMIHQASTSSTNLTCYQSIAAATGGSAVNEGGNLGSQIVTLINTEFTAIVADLHMEVASATPAPASASWISFVPAARTGVATPSTGNAFDVVVSVPAGTATGDYVFDLKAVGDGADLGHQILTVRVRPAVQDPHAQTVNTTADHDDGACDAEDCTLREAIGASNANPPASGVNTIGFAIAGSGSHTLTLESALPPITVPTSVDGTTEPGASCASPLASHLAIALRGSGIDGSAHGLSFGTGGQGSVVRGLVIEGFDGDGIHAQYNGTITIQCNVIGTSAHPNGGAGIWLFDVAGTPGVAAVGSDLNGVGDAAEANEISHNEGDGIVLGSTAGSAGVRLAGNAISDNGGLAIDLDGDGVTPNDTYDLDADGANAGQNFPVLVRAVSGSGGGIAGRLNVSPYSATPYQVALYLAPTCDTSGHGEGGALIGTATLTTPSFAVPPGFPGVPVDTDLQFVITMDGLPASGFVTATATDSTGSTSEYSACVALGPNNDSWPRALDISGPGNATGVLDIPGQSRWYKFAIAPGSTVTVDLTDPPGDYQIALFTDIDKAYEQSLAELTEPSDLNKLSAEFAAQAFSAQAFSGQAFSAQAFSPDAYSAQAFSAQAFSADVFAAQAFSAQAFSGQAFSAQAFSAQAFSGQAFSAQAFSAQAFSAQAFSAQAFSGQAFSAQAFSAQAFSAQAFSAQAFSSAQTRSLIAISAVPGPGPESVTANTWNNTGSFYVRVTGRDGAFDNDSPFELTVTRTSTECAGIHDMGSAPGDVSAGAVGYPVKTVILWDRDRIEGTDAEKAALAAALDAFRMRPEVGGAVVDVSGPGRISDLNDQADDHPACPFAKNLVAGALKDIVDSYREHHPLAYVVLVGGDDTIPFFRYADEALLAPESSYVPPVRSGSASDASLRLDYVLSQDAYGAGTEITQETGTFPVFELAVGRLVETAAEATGMLQAYATTSAGVVDTPTSSLVTGYDFLEDAATAVRTDLSAGIGSGATRTDTLITPNDLSPDSTDPAVWDATDLADTLLGERHDLVFLAGHFSANSALAADFDTTLLATELAASPVDMVNSIVFSIGCHSGYNIPFRERVEGITEPLDWTQAFAQKGATLIAGTGYQYGDTDFLEYSERIYSGFAHELRMGLDGPVSVGEALIRAKQAYLRDTPDIRGIDAKALLEATLFGLPMLSVDFEHGRIDPALDEDDSVVSPSAVTTGAGAALGLKSATLNVTDALALHSKTLKGIGTGDVTATWYSGPGEAVKTKPFEPALPLVTKDVSVPGMTLRGVGFRGGTYTDASVTPLTGAATTEIRGVHTPFGSPVFYPMQLATVGYFDAIGGGDTRLVVTPAQHRSNGPTSTTATIRTYTGIQLELFYSAFIGTFQSDDGQTLRPALAAAPSILDLRATESTPGSITFDVHVAGDPSAGIQKVWVTYTGFGGATDAWTSLDLVQDPNDSTHWSRVLAVPSGHSATEIRYLVQAVNGVGLVALADDYGKYYAIRQESNVEPAETTVELDASPAVGVYGTNVTVSADLGGATTVAGRPIEFTLGGATRTGITNGSGVAQATFRLASVPATYSLIATFLGDEADAPSVDTRSFKIEKVGTTLALTGAASAIPGGSTDIVATVEDDNGLAVDGHTVYFTLTGAGGSFTRPVITDHLGRASLGRIPASLPAGEYELDAFFYGEIPQPPSSATITLVNDTFKPSSLDQPRPFTILSTTPDLTFDLTTLPAKRFGDPPFSVAPYVTTNSDGPLSFALGDGSVGCSVTTPQGVVTITGVTSGAARCIVTVSVGKTALWSAAGPRTQSFAIGKATQAPLAITAPGIVAYGQTVGISTTGGSGTGALSFSAGSSTACSIVNGNQVRATAPTGACTLVATKAADPLHEAATSAPFPVAVHPGRTIGRDSVTVSGGSYVDSYDGGSYTGANPRNRGYVVSNGSITVSSSSVYGDIRSTRGAVTLSSSSVTGSVTAGGAITASSSTIGGTRTPNSAITALSLQSVAACTPFTAANRISGKFTYDAKSGNLTVTGGNTATLAAGAHCFNTVTLSGGSRLASSGPVIISLRGALTASGASVVNGTADASNFRILSSGSAITLSGGSKAVAAIYAPNASIVMSGSASITGVSIAKSVTMSGSSAVHEDTRLYWTGSAIAGP